jgi:AraC-like DNA-binding protein
MLGFIKDMLVQRETKATYWTKLSEFLEDNQLDEHEKKQLQKLTAQLGLNEQQLREAHKRATKLTFSSMISDSRITEEERKSLEDLADHFGISKEEYDFDQKAFNKFYILSLVENGILPDVKNHDIDIIFKKGEILHWGCPSALVKLKRVTTRVNYAGPVVSVRIMKGVRYRVGSVRASRETKEVLSTEDTGAFWITNQRVGFRGTRKNIAIPLDKVAFFEITASGLVISKEGRENPYIVSLEDYEVPAAILSHLLNS